VERRGLASFGHARYDTAEEKQTMARDQGFTKWLLQFQREKTAVGDLARTVAQDTEWQDPPTLESLESQLLGAGRPRAMIETARRAWRRYAGDRPGMK
jgi:hypothetical protein